MKEYKVVREEFPTLKMSIDKRLNEWETTLNQMAAQGWELKSALLQGIVVALIFEKSK